MTWKSTGDFVQPPIGTFPGRCFRMIDLGTRKRDFTKGGITKSTLQRRVMLDFELPTELMETGEHVGEPFTVAAFYTMSLGEKANLRKDLVNWRGRPFTPEELEGFEETKLLGAPAMLSLTRGEKSERVNITSIVRLPKSMECPPLVNTLMYISLEKDRYNVPAETFGEHMKGKEVVTGPNAFGKLSDGLKQLIIASPEWAELQGGGPRRQEASSSKHVDDFDDDIPF
jgi:hypothetical protein